MEKENKKLNERLDEKDRKIEELKKMIDFAKEKEQR